MECCWSSPDKHAPMKWVRVEYIVGYQQMYDLGLRAVTEVSVYKAKGSVQIVPTAELE